MTGRWPRFITIGFCGFVLQLLVLSVLTQQAGWSWLPATLVAVEAAVVHNFFWHLRWTWRDRPGSVIGRLVRFQVANGLASIGGNALLMMLFAGTFGWPSIPANIMAVAVMSIVNFAAADRWVFGTRRPCRLIATTCVAGLCLPAIAAAQSAETLSAWQRYVAATEARLEAARTNARHSDGDCAVTGESIRVPSGTISDWTGSVFIPGVTLDRLLARLQHPGTPPPQEDVLSSHVISRTDDSLRVSIRLVRRAIVTVTYDTEHDMRFRRWTPRLATARSVATRIEEEGGSDHGFLWRLHSYWRYEEVAGGVRVDLESLTLSRDVPSLVRPIASPLIAHVARESMTRTLEALQRFFRSSDANAAG
jgi:putative flippase GtrA